VGRLVIHSNAPDDEYLTINVVLAASVATLVPVGLYRVVEEVPADTLAYKLLFESIARQPIDPPPPPATYVAQDGVPAEVYTSKAPEPKVAEFGSVVVPNEKLDVEVEGE